MARYFFPHNSKSDADVVRAVAVVVAAVVVAAADMIIAGTNEFESI